MIDFDHCVLHLSPRIVMGSYWPDLSRYVNNGRIYGAELREGAFHMDIGKYIECEDNPSLNFGDGDFTIAIWVWGGSMSGNRGIVTKWDGSKGWALITDIDGRAYFKVSDGTNLIYIWGNKILFDSKEWIFIEVVYAPSIEKIKIFENGLLTREKNITPVNDYNTTVPLRLGQGGGYPSITGLIGEIFIFDNAQSDNNTLLLASLTSPYGRA